MNDLVKQRFDDWEWDDFQEKYYTDEDFKNDPNLYNELFVKWLNQLPKQKRFDFADIYQKYGAGKTDVENGRLVMYEELVFERVFSKNVVSREIMPDGSSIHSIEFFYKPIAT